MLVCATCHNITCRIQEVRESRSQPIREGNYSSAEPCNDYTERGLHPEHQEVIISEHFQAYPDKNPREL